MKRGIIFILVSVIILSVFIMSGCTSRRILGAQDHLNKPIMNFETFKTTHYILFPGSSVHEFWKCEEKGDNISCEKSCDGKTDISCPTGIMNISTNVR